jgi:hypothetical protein
VRKAAVLSPYIVIVIFNQLNIKKNKSINNFEKIITKKTMWGNTVVVHSVLKKKNYKVKFLTSLIFKK